MVVDVAEGAVLAQHVRHPGRSPALALLVAVLDDEDAAGAQQRGRRYGQAADDVEAVGTRRRARAAGRAAPPRGRAALRRPGCTAGWSRRRRRARPTARAPRGGPPWRRRRAARGSSPPRRRRRRSPRRCGVPRRRRLVELDRVHRRPGHLGGQRERDRARPGAEVDGEARVLGGLAEHADAELGDASRSRAGGRTPRGRRQGSRWRNGASPSRCCSGTRAARFTSRASKRMTADGSAGSERNMRPRGTSRTCASRSSASTRGDGTPAMASRRSASTSTSRSVRTGGV